MFETNFSYASASVLPTTISIEAALEILHDFETVIKLNPDCKGCKPIPPPKNGYPKPNGAGPNEKMEFYEVEDDLPFMPKKLWSGGVKYNAEFLPIREGCDITVHAPGGFTSTNHWRIIRETAPVTSDMHLTEPPEIIPEEDMEQGKLERIETKDLMHAESAGAGWYVQIISDARCPRTFAGIIKGFLKNSHAQLQHTFIDRLTMQAKRRETMADQPTTTSRPAMTSRPTLGRRRSTKF